MTAPVPPTAASVHAEPGSRLEQLADAYADAKPAADAATARLDEIVTAIKRELADAAPGAERIDFTAPALATPLRMTAKTTWRFDSKRCKAEAPAIYVRFAVQSTTWELRAMPS